MLLNWPFLKPKCYVLMLGTDYIIVLPFEIVTVSEEAIIESKVLAVKWLRDMADYIL